SIWITSDQEYIQSGAFSGFTNLEYIIFNSSVTGIGDNAFNNVPTTCKILFNGTEEQFNLIINKELCSEMTIYYYSDTTPTETGNYWHIVDGKYVIY
ncbi:MAG: leucine-rich repeat domain-containing protein, partial [Acholeplasmatales bacterium]|nr:leucine-rich repeat domain-containing protein [Acholeplasmatales bacterium]